MSNIADELRKSVASHDAAECGYTERDWDYNYERMREAADLLDEAERALETIAISARSAVTMQAIARATLARIRGDTQ